MIADDDKYTPAERQAKSVKDYTNTIAPTPDWLKEIGSKSKRKGLNKRSMRQIDAEIAAARRERRQKAAVNPPTK